MTFEADVACGGLIESGKGFTQGGLAASTFTDEAQGFARINKKVHTINSLTGVGSPLKNSATHREVKF
jgi:hypothetical protein